MKIFIKHLIMFTFAGVLFVCFYFFSVPCPIKYFFHVPCVTCGATRAFLALLKSDFKSYLNYNAMAIPILISIILGFHLKFFKGKLSKFINALMILTIILSLIYNFCRILYYVQI